MYMLRMFVSGVGLIIQFLNMNNIIIIFAESATSELYQCLHDQCHIGIYDFKIHNVC